MTISFFIASINFSSIFISSLFLASIPTGQILSPVTSPSAPTNISSSITEQNRLEQLSKVLRTNRPTVNSLMHLFGPWILDACLLQIKDRYSRSSTITNTNDSKHKYFHLIHTSENFLLVPRMNEIDKTLDNQVYSIQTKSLIYIITNRMNV